MKLRQLCRVLLCLPLLPGLLEWLEGGAELCEGVNECCDVWGRICWGKLGLLVSTECCQTGHCGLLGTLGRAVGDRKCL